MTITKSGYVALVGRPNVGKSTLLNYLLDEKISITSSKPQTTRWQILGVKTHGDAQIIYVDTPGVQHETKRAMNRYLNRVAHAVLSDADVIIFLVDATSWRAEDALILEKLKQTKCPIILGLNKIDLLKNKSKLLPLIDRLKEKFNFAHIIPISAIKGDNINDLEKVISKLLPRGPQYFPKEQKTDKNIRFRIAEIIREKLIMLTEEELPYTTSVEIEQFATGKKITEIGAIIWVERPGQKAIVIGKGGARLKKMGVAARREIELLLKSKVFLRLWVKVKEHWTDDERALKSLGYE